LEWHLLLFLQQPQLRGLADWQQVQDKDSLLNSRRQVFHLIIGKGILLRSKKAFKFQFEASPGTLELKVLPHA
jgi:hypothetical protein